VGGDSGGVDDVVEVVEAAIKATRLENVDSEAVTVTGEGVDVAIVLVPHRDLGGVALVVWSDERSIDLLWTQISDLARHDEIDLGVRTATVVRSAGWQDRLARVLAVEFVRPIELQAGRTLLGKTVVKCRLRLEAKDKQIGVVRPDDGRTGKVEGLRWETALSAGDALPFSVPAPVALWRRNA